MKRIDFLKKAGISLFSATALAACTKDSLEAAATPETGTTNPDGTTTSGGTNTTCTATPSETAGPFPTKSPASFVIKDIRSDRTGVPLAVLITIQNKNKSCAGLEGAIVDVWHCDKDGNYSEYGGLTSVHFLRGRQTTNAAGLAAFTTIFPGWYSGRAPHIHVHIFNASGKSLLVTQIAFPTDICDNVYTNATKFYTRGKQDTSNARDGIFADSLALEMPTVSGSIADGYTLSHNIVVSV